MSNNPYRDGGRDYARGWMQNPYTDHHKREEWQQGYNEAEAAERASRSEHLTRRANLWNVPERARDAYMAMEDDFSAATVLDFMLAMHPEDE